METLLQIWGGLFYTLNKIFFAFSEQAKARGKLVLYKQWRVGSWVLYLLGLPAWVILLAGKHAWIAAALEAGGGPAMLLGLVTALRGTAKDPPKWLDRLAFYCIVLGLGYSVYDFGGINTLAQWLELGLASGYLVGTYKLAREHSSGYLWYLLMHISCGWLMLVSGYYGLAFQQGLSLVFITDAYRISRRANNEK